MQDLWNLVVTFFTNPECQGAMAFASTLTYGVGFLWRRLRKRFIKAAELASDELEDEDEELADDGRVRVNVDAPPGASVMVSVGHQDAVSETVV